MKRLAAIVVLAAGCSPVELRAYQAHLERVEAERVAHTVTVPPPWPALAQCESGGRWHLDGRFDGGLQFMPSTWRAYGGREFAEYAWQATPRQQVTVAERVVAAEGGFGAWPHCRRVLGLAA